MNSQTFKSIPTGSPFYTSPSSSTKWIKTAPTRAKNTQTDMTAPFRPQELVYTPKDKIILF